VSDDEKAEAGKRIYLAMRIKRPLGMYSRNEDPKETLIDLLMATAVMFSSVPEDDAVKMMRDCLRWVRGDATAGPPTPPETLN
jgi:hypothetical protein